MKRHHAPVALVVIALGTIVLSISVSIASGDYYDGLSVPFISYVGRDEPSYYVFAIGMSLSGAGVAVVAVLERAWIVRAREAARCSLGSPCGLGGAEARLEASGAASTAAKEEPGDATSAAGIFASSWRARCRCCASAQVLRQALQVIRF